MKLILDGDFLHGKDPDPFGMITYGRSWQTGSDYRYGFNGKEQDDEVIGDGNVYDYGFRIYNARIGKFLSVDPSTESFPWYSPYHFAGNKPIIAVDLDGLEEYIVIRFYCSGVLQFSAVMKVPDENQIAGMNGTIYFEINCESPKENQILSDLFSTTADGIIESATDPSKGDQGIWESPNQTQWDKIIDKENKVILAGSYQDQSTNGDPNGLRPYERDIVNYKARKGDPIVSPSDEENKGKNVHGTAIFISTSGRSVFFNNNESTLDVTDRAAIGNLGKLLGDFPSLSASVVGNTDLNASVKYNLALGQARANSVSTFLQSTGAQTSQLNISSNGESKADQNSPSQLQMNLNRNVNISINYPTKGQ